MVAYATPNKVPAVTFGPPLQLRRAHAGNYRKVIPLSFGSFDELTFDYAAALNTLHAKTGMTWYLT